MAPSGLLYTIMTKGLHKAWYAMVNIETSATTASIHTYITQQATRE